jgi:RNA polymerase sigma-70 factor (ECF subfamily)
MNAAPSTRYSLLVRIQDQHDHAAWLEFVAIYEPLVYSLARRRGLQDADARDLCQDVFRSVAKAVHAWKPDPDRGSFRGWLFRIAQNLLVNFLRRERRQPRASGDSDVQRLLDAQPTSGDEFTRLIEFEYRRRLFQVAARQIEAEFTTATWQAFWQTTVESQPIVRVAEALELSQGAVYIARSRVLARLRERVQQIAGEDGTW